MEELFRIEDGKVYFGDGRGYGAEECIDVINNLISAINTGAITISVPKQRGLRRNVINYEDILDKRIIAGDNSKSTQILKQWLDNDPEVIAEDTEPQPTIV